MLRLARLAAVASAIALAVPAVAAAVEIETAKGPVTLAGTPEKVAVFDIAAIDTLLALGIVPAGVPDKLYVPYLGEDAAKAPKVGTLFEPNLEAVAGLAPDLIVIGGRSSTQGDALAPIAPVIDMTIGSDVVAEAKARLTAYGKAFGKEAKAAELTAALDAELAAVAKAAEGKGTALVLLTNGTKLSAYGAGSRFGWIHSALGLPQAREGLKTDTHGDAISFEFIAETNPDWIFVIDRGAAIGEAGSAAATLDNPLVKGTKAAKAEQIVYLSPATIYIAGGGYTSLMGTLAELKAALAK